MLAGEVRVEDLVKRRRRPIGATATPSRTPPSVTIENDESDFYTIVDVSANDRLGLLYDLTRTLAEHDLEIYISKATTVLDQVADTFYVKDARDGGIQKLADPDAHRGAAARAARSGAARRGAARRRPSAVREGRRRARGARSIAS